MTYKVGDAVRIKSGVKIPDCSIDFSHWQGRISSIEKDGTLAIDWDSHSLKSLPTDYIKESITDGYGWEQMYFFFEDIEPFTARDTPEQTAQILAELEHQFCWAHLGEVGDRIHAVLAETDPEDENSEFEAWYHVLHKSLSLPFDAEVTEWQELGSFLQSGAVVKVTALSHEYTDYGLYVKVENKGKHGWFPLSDLEAIDTKSENHTRVHDYVMWFANR